MMYSGRKQLVWQQRIALVLLILVAVAGTGCEHAAPADSSEAESTPAAENVQKTALSFKEVTAQAGLASFRHETGAFGERWFPEAMGAGGGFIDYNGDGWLDVLLVGGGEWPQSEKEPPPALWLYRNNGDGTFSDATEEAGLGDIAAYGFGITAADYDNDGDEDFYFTTINENMLFENEGGTFTEVAKKKGVAGDDLWSTSALFFDADRDGHLDLYVGSYVKWSPENDIVCTVDGQIRSYCTPLLYEGIPSRYYHNNGDGTFTDRTEEAGFLPAPGKTLGVAETDFNDDGWPDLIVANDTERDLLYENDGDGTFTEKGMVSGVAYDENGSARAGMGIDVGVVDSTGEETMFVGNFSKEMIAVFRHAGSGLFVDRAAISKIGQPSLLTLTFGLFLFDADLDRDLDLFAANGHVQPEINETKGKITYREKPHLFLNRGTGTFFDAAPRIGGVFDKKMVARGAAYGDYDRDGDQDVLLTENSGPAHLWRNDLLDGSEAGPHFLRVDTEGRESNRDGIGTRIVAVVNGERMERRVRTGSSFLAQLEKTVTFGIGGAAGVDSLHVYWPSGQHDRFVNIDVDQEIRIVEGMGQYERVPMQSQQIIASR